MCPLPFACRPYDSGEVVVQPYNCMLTLSTLAQHSDGIILTHNGALAATCQQLLGTERPTFGDLNSVAARNLASVLLPATQQQAPAIDAASVTSSSSTGGSGGSGRVGRPAWDSCGGSELQAAAGRQAQPAGEPAWDGTFGSGSRWGDEAQGPNSVGGSRGGAGGRLDPLADVCERLCSQPGHRLLTLRSCPQLPPSSFDYTAFSWPVVLKNLRQMQLAGKGLEAGLDWSSGAGSSSGASSASSSSSSMRRASLGALSGRALGVGVGSGNRALASLLVLR